MKKISVAIIAFSFSFTLLGCNNSAKTEGFFNSYYSKIGNKIYGHDVNGNFEIDEADPATFSAIGNTRYAQDKNAVYYYGIKMEDSDPKSFAIMKDGFSKDKNHIYYYSDQLKNADIDSFEILFSSMLGNAYSKDKHAVYFNEKMIPGADLKTFQIDDINKDYSKNKNHSYFDGQLIQTDPKNLKILQYPWSIDKENAYNLNHKLINADPKSFEVLDFYYAKDKNSVYFAPPQCNCVLANCNCDTISILPGADPKTFVLLDKNGRAEDKNSQYLLGEKIENIDNIFQP